MNWDAVSAISQLVGSVAVVLSVLYLAMQVHRSTRVAKLATQDAAATALREVTKPFMENAEVERIWRVGLENVGALSVEERARFFHAAYQFLKETRSFFRSEEHTSELQSRLHLVCRLLLEKKNKKK